MNTGLTVFICVNRWLKATEGCPRHQTADSHMFWLKRTTGLLVFAVLLSLAATQISSQEPAKPRPSPEPSPTPEESVKVFTEEVRLPVMAFDAYGHFDPTLELDDILVLEDGVAQQIRSVRH